MSLRLLSLGSRSISYHRVNELPLSHLRVTLGHLMVTVGQLHNTLSQHRVIIGSLRATKGHIALGSE